MACCTVKECIILNVYHPQISMNVRILKETIVTPTLFVVTLQDLSSVDVLKDMREMALIAQVQLLKSISGCHSCQQHVNGSANS